MRTPCRSRLLSLLSLLPSTLTVPAQSPSADAEIAARTDAVFAEFTKPGSPGAALAIVRNGAIVYAKGYGLANLEHGVPIDPQRTVFDIGSTSKQFTAACVLLLAQDGKLSLDDDVRKFLPELRDYGTAVTLRHLLHHTSGVRDYCNLMALGGLNLEDHTTDDDALAVLRRQRSLDFVPGTEHSYSNSGYFLLSLVVARSSGMSLAKFAAERIFVPLGMASTRILDDHTAVIAHRATGYAPREDGSGFGVQMSNWEQTGDGAVQTTVADLARWDQNFHEPKVGGPALVEQLQTKGTLADGSEIDYARGLVVSTYRGLRCVSHGGAWAGYRAEMMRFPDQRFTVIVLCNVANAQPTALAYSVADVHLAEHLAKPDAAASPAVAEASAADVHVPAEVLSRHAGLYWGAAAGVLRTIVVRGEQLVYVRQPGNESVLAPLGPGVFRMVGTPTFAKVEFPDVGAGARRRMLVTAGSGKPSEYVEVQPAAPTTDLRAFVGTYVSEELDATWTFQLDGDHLMGSAKRGGSAPVEPLFEDAFGSPMGVLRFERDADKHVTGLVISVGRARGLRFAKQAP